MCGAASRMRPPPAIPQPTTLLTTSPPGATFSTKMTTAMTPIQKRFIIPTRRSANIRGQLDPRQYIPCPRPARLHDAVHRDLGNGDDLSHCLSPDSSLRVPQDEHPPDWALVGLPALSCREGLLR